MNSILVGHRRAILLLALLLSTTLLAAGTRPASVPAGGGKRPSPLNKQRPSAAKAATGKEGEERAGVLAWVNGEELTYEQYDDMTRLTELRYDSLSAKRMMEIKADSFSRLVERRLMVQEALRRGMEVSALELHRRWQEAQGGQSEAAFCAVLGELGLDSESYRRMLYEDLVVEKLLARVLPRQPRIGEREIDDYYFRHLGDFVRQDMVRARQIFLEDEREAQVVWDGLRHGADFQELARRRSRAREAAQGGELGYFGRADMPSFFFESCWAWPVGAYSGVVRSHLGYHIFLVEDKVPEHMLTKEQARPQIVAALREGKREEDYRSFVKSLSARAEIKMSKRAQLLGARP